MGNKDRLTRGLVLRAGIVLTALCMCIHVYLDRGRRGGAPAPSSAAAAAAGRPAPQTTVQEERRGLQTGARRDPMKPLNRHEEDRTVKRRVSYVRTLKKDSLNAARSSRDGDGGDEPRPSPTCCPPLHPRRKSPRWHIDLEPWASGSHSLEDEARRFLSYITTPQVTCESLSNEDSPWTVCLDPKYSLMHSMDSKHCRVYSLGLGVDDRSLERSLAGAGCEVHCFDPSLKQAHQQEANMWLHRLSVDWRDPNPGLAAQRQYQQHATTKKLATILNDFGHRQVDVLKADMESAEWKILENLLLEGVLDSVGQLLLEVHLHWAGFEVAGDDPSVVRYWFSLLRELQRANFRLFRSHSDAAKPRLFLHRNVLNASSVYTLGWVNTQWKP